MTIRYCDPAASGDNDGTSWINAYQTFQQALDNSEAGDVCYCRGAETIAATLDVDTNAGTNAGGYIKFIGCNALGNRDGTRFVLDANNGDFDGITFIATSDMIWFENIEIKNTGGTAQNGFHYSASTGTGNIYVNCAAHNCSGNGWGFGTNGFYNNLIRCTSYANTLDGFNGPGQRFVFCSAHDNGRMGFQDGITQPSVFIGCISYDNADDGFYNIGPLATMFGCVSNGNADDGVVVAATTSLYTALIACCRITNHSGAGDIGLNTNGEPIVTLGCYFEDNDGDNIQGGTIHENASLDGSSISSNKEDQANTNEGYTDKTNGDQDFTLRSDASLRRTAITIPTENTDNKYYISAGLVPNDPAAAGGGSYPFVG